MQKKIIVIWTRQSEAQSEPLLNAYKKEDQLKTYLGVPIKGGRKYLIPDNEENQEICECFDGIKWRFRDPEEAKPKVEKPALVIANNITRRPGNRKTGS